LFEHPDPPSGTLAVAVAVTEPAFVHVKVGDAEFVLLNVPLPVPPVSAQENCTSELLPLPSTPWAARLRAEPMSTEEGLAETAVTAAHGLTMDTVPVTLTDPLWPASTLLFVQTRLTVALEVEPATIPKLAEPVQGRAFDVVPASAIV
jgi:hypothetical protein